jgi:alkanesulfonate monooxygenase SsuD/methylene tetrahydromethanopterin reductase-like flavin-dependent oxidoreductase (luciferase family)
VKVGLLIMDEHPGVALRVAKAADVAGVHSIWSIDYYNQSSLARAAAFAAATNSVLIGTSVTPLFARSPLALAAAAIDIQLMSAGRFVLGVGSSTRRMNRDWYGFDLDHPAPRVEERIRLVRKLMMHDHGRFDFHGRFDAVTMAHYERKAACARPVPIMAAGVGSWMVTAAGRAADGFFGHTVASAENLAEAAKPLIDSALRDAGRAGDSFTFASQVIASVDADTATARDRAALQVGFYSTPKGYDVLFPDEEDQANRARAREAFQGGDIVGVGRAGNELVSKRAVFGTAGEVSEQLKRYSGVLDLALLYPPSFGVDPSDITKNEYALIEIAAHWPS